MAFPLHRIWPQGRFFMEQNDLIKSIILYDEDDNEIEFDIMDRFELEGDRFYVLFPVDDDSDDKEYVILRDLGDERLAGIDDEALLDRVFDHYKRRHNID